MFRNQMVRFLTVACASFTSFACASGNHNTTSASVQGARDAVVVVHNSNTRDINLYVMNGPNRVRLGTASALATSRLKLPGVLLTGSSGVTFHADAIGSTVSYTFPAVHLNAGNRVELQLGSVLAMSGFGVW
jgi:hypothetical protein